MRDVLNDAYAIISLAIFLIAHVVGTHLNCLELSRQFK